LATLRRLLAAGYSDGPSPSTALDRSNHRISSRISGIRYNLPGTSNDGSMRSLHGAWACGLAGSTEARPEDSHEMAGVMQASARPLQYDYATVTGDLRHNLAFREGIRAKAADRIVTEGISPEQAVDEAIARIKQILSE
jgi:hypothetical protein